MDQKKFYITTPIYYPSDKLHIGHTYCTVATDAMARYKRLQGYNVKFLTGTDEHGQKIELKAKEAGVTPQQFVDNIVEGPKGVKDLWKLMNISYDRFIRTTDDYHVAAIQKIFKKMYEKGDIYKGKYVGKYCTPCESFWTESQLVNGCCPDCGRPVVDAEEEAYFFRLSKYADRVRDLLVNTDFLLPRSRVNEMVHNFIDPGLEDLCVSRTSFKWGIPVDFDPKHVVYVWIDALFNYTTALGFMNDKYPDSDYETFWPADVHFIGKEIVRFHSIIWPAMLMSMDMPLPKHVYGHGWLLLDGGKMSKSKGNVVDPYLLAERYSADALRYFLLRDFPFGSDGTFSNEALITRINSDLANDLGNLVSRTVAMVNKYFGGTIPTERTAGEFDEDLIALATATKAKVEAYADEMQFSQALTELWALISRTNKYIDETAPWVLVKEESKSCQLASVMSHLAASLRVVAHLIQPFMMTTSDAIMEQLGMDKVATLEDLNFAGLPAGLTVVAKGTPIFPRLDMEEEIAYIQAQMGGGSALSQEEEKEWNPADVELKNEKAAIKFEAFDAVEIRVAEVKEVKKVEGSDKLLQFRLDAGDGEDRQILSGIAQFYPNEQELVGKKVQIVANLKPRKMMGLLSQGMILSAEHEGNLTLLTVDPSVPNGSQIG